VARRRSGRHCQSPAALARSRQQACSVNIQRRSVTPHMVGATRTFGGGWVCAEAVATATNSPTGTASDERTSCAHSLALRHPRDLPRATWKIHRRDPALARVCTPLPRTAGACLLRHWCAVCHCCGCWNRGRKLSSVSASASAFVGLVSSKQAATACSSESSGASSLRRGLVRSGRSKPPRCVT